MRGDSLHILYSRGVGSHLAGSLLHYLLFHEGAKARQTGSPGKSCKAYLAEWRNCMWKIMWAQDSPAFDFQRFAVMLQSPTQALHAWRPRKLKQSASFLAACAQGSFAWQWAYSPNNGGLLGSICEHWSAVWSHGHFSDPCTFWGGFQPCPKVFQHLCWLERAGLERGQEAVSHHSEASRLPPFDQEFQIS